MSHISLATQREVEIVEAAKRLAVTDLTTLQIFFRDEWAGAQRQALSAGSGANVPDPNRPGNILLSSGATGSSLGGFYLLEMAAAPNSLPPNTGGEWYASCRFIVTTAVDAQAGLSGYTGSSGTGDYLFLGVEGATSTTKYSARFTNSGAAITSTVTVDTSAHTARLWRKSGATLLSVDGETPVSGNTFPGTSFLGNGAFAQNGTTAANRAISIDWQFTAFVRATS